MDEDAAGPGRRGWRRASGSLGRVATAQASRTGPTSRGRLREHHEMAIHPRHTIRLIVRRRGFRMASSAFLVVAPWCRDQQLTSDRVLRLGAESTLLTSLSHGLALASRLTVVLLHFEPKTSKRSAAGAPVAHRAVTAGSANRDRVRGAVHRLGSAGQRLSLEVRHVLRPDRAPDDQVPRKPL
jgi:hypothetical protein